MIETHAGRPTWLAELRSLVHELPGMLGERVELFALEAHRAGAALLQIAALLAAAAVLGLACWLLVAVGAIWLLVALGWTWQGTLLSLLLVHLIALAGIVWRIRALLPQLGLPATRRHLSFGRPAASTSAVSPASQP